MAPAVAGASPVGLVNFFCENAFRVSMTATLNHKESTMNTQTDQQNHKQRATDNGQIKETTMTKRTFITLAAALFFVIVTTATYAGTVESSAFIDAASNAISTTGTVDWGYVSQQANNSKSGGFGSISEVNANNVAFGSLTLGAYGNLTTVSGSSSIGAVTFTEGAPSDVLNAAFTAAAGGFYTFDGNAAHGDMRGMGGNEQDVWTMNFNDLGIGKFEVTLYLGVSTNAANRIFDMDYSLIDGSTVSGTSVSATGNTYTLYNAAEDFYLFSYSIVGKTTTAGADLSLTFGGVSGDSNGEILLSGYTVSVIPEPSTAILAGLGLMGVCFRRRRSVK